MINLYEGKIKYETLDKILKPNILSEVTSDNIVSLTIDLKSFFRKIYRISSHDEDIVKEDIVSEILNMVGHFRNYFFKLKKYTDVSLIYNPIPSEIYRNEFSEYKNKLYNFQHELDLVSLFTEAFNMLQVITAYIPNTNVINTSPEDEYVYTREILNASGSKYKILITTDDMMLPMVSHCDTILIPKGDKSVVVNQSNAVSYLVDKDGDDVVGYKSLNLLLSISGCKKNEIPGLKGYSYKKAHKLLTKMIEGNKLISNEYLEDNSLREILKEYLKEEDVETIIKNYSFLNLDHLIRKEKINISDIEMKLERFKIKKNTTISCLQEVNERIMRAPINLEFLLRGEEMW